jgi:tRNA(fMet)-specific endonuclease VapC
VKGAILDTDVFSLLLKQNPTADSYRQLVSGFECSISFATVGEVYDGVFRSQWPDARRKTHLAALDGYFVIHSGSAICETWGWIRSQRKSRPIAMNDAWIAATALVYGLPLITHNVRDYNDIPKLKVLTVSQF